MSYIIRKLTKAEDQDDKTEESIVTQKISNVSSKMTSKQKHDCDALKAEFW